MSKLKKTGPLKYEILYIVSNKFSEKEVEKINGKALKIISDQKCAIIKTKNLGKRQLAYKINKDNYGYYNLIVFESEGKKIALIDKAVRQMREILRYAIVRYIPERIALESSAAKAKSAPSSKTVEKIEEAKNKTAARKEEKAEEEKAELQTKKEEKITEEKSDKAADAKNEAKKEEKAQKDDEDLNKKLDDILEAKNLF